jgi:phage tail-like protein
VRKLAVSGTAFLAVGILVFLLGHVNHQSNLAEAQEAPGDPELRVELQIDGISGFFTECSGLGSEHELEERKAHGVIRKIPGRLKWGDITLKRGISSDTAMWEWRKLVEQGDMERARKNGSIIMFDRSSNPIAKWNFENAWPSKITGASQKADSNEFGVEEVTLVTESVDRVR